jgi:hypothetical protein
MKKFVWIATLVVILSLAVPWAAFADYVVNNIDTTLDDAEESVTIASGGSTAVGFYVMQANDFPAGDANGCNAAPDPVTITLNVPDGVTANPK